MGDSGWSERYRAKSLAERQTVAAADLLIPYPLSPIPYPLSPIPYPLSAIPYPLSAIPIPSIRDPVLILTSCQGLS